MKMFKIFVLNPYLKVTGIKNWKFVFSDTGCFPFGCTSRILLSDRDDVLPPPHPFFLSKLHFSVGNCVFFVVVFFCCCCCCCFSDYSCLKCNSAKNPSDTDDTEKQYVHG